MARSRFVVLSSDVARSDGLVLSYSVARSVPLVLSETMARSYHLVLSLSSAQSTIGGGSVMCACPPCGVRMNGFGGASPIASS